MHLPAELKSRTQAETDAKSGERACKAREPKLMRAAVYSIHGR
jgi:hypothetical protein